MVFAGEGPEEDEVSERHVLQKDLVTLGTSANEVLFNLVGDEVHAYTPDHSHPTGTPGSPSVVKAIDGSNVVRFTVTPGTDAFQEIHETYRFDLYDEATGTAIRVTKTLTSQGVGSKRLRDRWVEFTTTEQTHAGYTPGPTETFSINVVQVGTNGDSPDNQQTL